MRKKNEEIIIDGDGEVKAKRFFFITVLSFLLIQPLTTNLARSLISRPQDILSQSERSLLNSKASTETYWVDDDGNGDGTSADSPAPSITYILDVYNLTNDIVKVNPGLYNEDIEDFPLELDCSNMTLKATSIPSDTIINGTGLSFSKNIKVIADDITINGFTIKNSYDGIYLESSNNKIRSNIIKSNEDDGIHISSWSHNNVITGNKISNNGYDGIYLDSGGNWVYKNNFVGNEENADDISGDNHFNTTLIGNYWADYTGEDDDGDGVGDRPYNVGGETGSADYLPAIEPINISDSQPPSITIRGPRKNQAKSSQAVTVKWNGSDENGIRYYKIRIDNGAWNWVGLNNSYTFKGLDEGNHKVKIMAIDSAWNKAKKSTSFIVDTTSPNVSISTPRAGSTVQTTGNITVEWSGNDSTTSIIYYITQLDSYPWVNTTKSQIQLTDVVNGSHIIRVKAYDKANNSATSSVSFQVFRDTDQDGLSDPWEKDHSTDPFDPDTDGDGMPDEWEVENGLNPTDDDSGKDPDSDNLSNLAEYENHTDPKRADTDGDGVPDGWEVENGLNPTKDDSGKDPDGDGLTNLEEYDNDTNPHQRDTDGDGMPDGWEVENELDPINPDDEDNDPDGDGLINLEEFKHSTNPFDKDSDNDGLQDGLDPFPTLFGLLYGIIGGGGITVVVLAIFLYKSMKMRRWMSLIQEQCNRGKVVELYQIREKFGLSENDVDRLRQEIRESKDLVLLAKELVCQSKRVSELRERIT